MIVALTIEGVEFSNLQYERVLEELHASGAALARARDRHAVAVDDRRDAQPEHRRSPRAPSGPADGAISCCAEMAIPDALQQLADELLNQYVVTYGRPETLIPPEKVAGHGHQARR